MEIQDLVRIAKKYPNVDLEIVCQEVKVAVPELLEQLTRIAYCYNFNVGKIINAVNIPDVMKASIGAALQPEGIEDRKLQLGIAGMMPKSGPLVNVNIGTGPRSEDFVKDLDFIDVPSSDQSEEDSCGREQSSEGESELSRQDSDCG